MTPSKFAPIALFAYRRDRHLALTLDALAACPEFPETSLFVFSDAGKDDAAQQDVARVRAMLRHRGLPNMVVIEAAQHRGLAASVSAGVTDLCNRFGRAIVLEDDLLVAPSTLEWLNGGLEKYRDDAEVWQISAQQFAVPEFKARTEGLFLHLTTSWGWATWKRAWDQYDPEAKGWEAVLRDDAVRQAFDLNGTYPYAKMLVDQMNGRVDSWAIRWRWSFFRGAGISLYPPRSLVRNIGFDATATHTRFRLAKRLLRGGRRLVTQPPMEKCPILPDQVEVVPGDDQAISRATRNAQRLSRRIMSALGFD